MRANPANQNKMLKSNSQFFKHQEFSWSSS